MKKQYGFYLDANSCTGCNACVIACKDKNNLPLGVFWRRTYEIEGGYITVSCNHCQNPPCVISCPFGAIEKRAVDGLVAVNVEKCKGCRKCIDSCPYGSLQINKDSGKMGKCDGCLDLQNQGEAPACITACPMRAIEFGSMEKLTSKHPDAVSIDLIMKKDKHTLPSFLAKPHRGEVRNHSKPPKE